METRNSKFLPGARHFCLAGIFSVIAISPAVAESSPLPADIDFTVFRGDAPIGRHVVRFDRQGDAVVAQVEIDLKVKFGFITLFDYSHRNREVWRGDRLVALDSRTDDNGRLHEVRARTTPDGLEVQADGRVFMAPSNVMPTSYWRPDTLDRKSFLDTQRGRLIDLDISADRRETVANDQASIAATRYRVAGDLDLTLWYADSGHWLGVAFDGRGAEIRYRPSGVDDLAVSALASGSDGG